MPAPLDEEARAQIAAERALGGRVVEIGRRYDVAPSTVSRVHHDFATASGVLSQRSVSLYERVLETISMMAENQRLVLERQRERLLDDEWTAKQTGRDYAAMSGTLSKELRGWVSFAQSALSGGQLAAEEAGADCADGGLPDTHE